MELYSLEAEERTVLGKKSKNLSKEQKLPAVMYGKGMKTCPISLDAKAFAKVHASAGHTSVVEVILSSPNSKEELRQPVLIWDVKRHPVKGNVQHVDLYSVNLKEKITVRIPIVLTGISKGVKLGGKLDVYREYLDIMALPEDLIKEIVIDITDVDVNQTLRLEDIQVPATVTKVYDKNVVLLSVKLNEAKEEVK